MISRFTRGVRASALQSLPGARTLPLLALCICVLAACSSTPQRSQKSSIPNRVPGAPIIDPTAGLEEISIQAMALVGTPYRYGGNTPDAGFDCSGLVRYVVNRSASVSLPRTTAEMGTRGNPLQRSEIAAGDLVFFNTTGHPHSHVGIYVGQNRFVHAPSSGGTVRLEDMTKSYWARRYTGARRVVAAGSLTPIPSSPMTAAARGPASLSTEVDEDDPIAAFARK
jgi:cell wall-associated NlpC family hydrolase